MQRHKALLVIVILAILTRLPFLNIFPPGGVNTLLPRLITAISAIISIVLLYVVVLQKTGKKDLAQASALILTLLPWHIEQSRIYSPFMLALSLLLMVALLWQIAPCKSCKTVLLIFSSIVIWRLLPDLWMFHPPYILPSLTKIIINVFKILSVDFLFFNNDSFWFGGLRTTGVLLPSEIVIFMVGLAAVITNFVKRNLWLVFLFIVFLLLAALDPLFPETRVLFLSTPLLALLAAQGILHLNKMYQHKAWPVKAAIVFYVIVLLYEHIIFVHTYTSHYTNRFANDIPYEERTY
ncbi:hypothetical protein C4564_00505 [Candidatus Microgenomates bacterium]|nr:MAG: hypothetical protein C4564_00505 [Candidatus Microgenomates bacterium]